MERLSDQEAQLLAASPPRHPLRCWTAESVGQSPEDAEASSGNWPTSSARSTGCRPGRQRAGAGRLLLRKLELGRLLAPESASGPRQDVNEELLSALQ